MNKLLFYSDFLNFKLTGVSISGTRYLAHTHGPVPQKFRTLFDYLSENKIVDLVSVQYSGGFVGEEFINIPSKKFNSTLFDKFEIDILAEIASKFENYNATEIRDLSHQEKVWIDNEKNKGLIAGQTHTLIFKTFNRYASFQPALSLFPAIPCFSVFSFFNKFNA
ncbi:SocA family protein, partial [Tenacibaculum finnmarkense genomovar finnmarkense]|nr:SocA family protein [Tenacibaculum finnmarkense genomovar finnmarkense]